MRQLQTLALLVGGCLTTAAIAAADVQLSMRDGRVSIVAKDATVAEILAEWARVGQTTVVNADTLPRERVTIELKDVTEDRALAVLLRKASGYVAVSRGADLPDASRFDRILLMRATVAPAPATAPAALKAAAAAQPDPAAGDAGDANAADDPDPSVDATLRGRDPGASPGARDPDTTLPAREGSAGAAGLGASAASTARARAAEQARADGGIGGDDAPPANASTATAAPAFQPPAAPAAADRPPERPMPAGQMSDRRAAAAQAPRDRPAVPRPQAPEPIVGDVPDFDPTVLAPGTVPPDDPEAQQAFKRRRATETVDPRTYKFQLPAPAVAVPAAPSAAKPGVVTKGPGQ